MGQEKGGEGNVISNSEGWKDGGEERRLANERLKQRKVILKKEGRKGRTVRNVS